MQNILPRNITATNEYKKVNCCFCYLLSRLLGFSYKSGSDA